jgi:hypothetical protein
MHNLAVADLEVVASVEAEVDKEVVDVAEEEVEDKVVVKRKRKVRITISFLEYQGMLLLNKLRKHSKRWLSKIIQIRIRMIQKLQRKSFSQLLLLMKHYLTNRREKSMMSMEQKVFRNLKEDVDQGIIIWTTCSQISLVMVEVLEVDILKMKGDRNMKISLPTQM